MSNIFKSPARVLVNTVNTVGVMGKGIAKDFKRIYPEMFKEYQILCEKNEFEIGRLWLYKTKNKWVLNFPTKKHWRSPSKVEYIEKGLQKFVATYAENGITSISFPMLGCGNGELSWEKDVRPLMEHYLKNLRIDVYIHLYQKDPFEKEHWNIKTIKEWLRNEPESLAFIELWEDIKELLTSTNVYKTLDNEVDFKAYWGALHQGNVNQEFVQVVTKDCSMNVYEEQFLELWQHIRSLGFCIDSSMPNELDKLASYLVAVLEKLPYLKPVLISSNYETIGKNSIGLQYIPQIEQSRLFPCLNEYEATIHEKIES